MYFEFLTAALAAQLAFASACLSLLAYIPYIRDLLRGRTQPQRASWLIWTVLCAIAFSAQAASGATHSLWFIGAQLLGTSTVLAFAMFKGRGAYLSMMDVRVLCVAAGGLVLWQVTNMPAFALAIVIGISALGGLLTVCKCLQDPASETCTTWVLSMAAAALSLLSIPQGDVTTLAYPLYLFTLYACFVAAILIGRRATPPQPMPVPVVRPPNLHPSLPVLAPPMPPARASTAWRSSVFRRG